MICSAALHWLMGRYRPHGACCRCAGVRDAAVLPELAAYHRSIHPSDARAAPPSLFNRCHQRVAPTLERLMHYCWAPALAAADAAAAEAVSAVAASRAPRGGGGAGAAAGAAVARLNHSWDEVVARLEDVRAQRRPILRFV